MAFNSLSVLPQSPYVVNNNINFVKRKNAEQEEAKETEKQASRSVETAIENNPKDAPKKDLKEELRKSEEAHKNAVASRDARLKSASVNIAQIIKDFRSTGKAIGTPDDIAEEVEAYLALVEKQAKKESPDAHIVKSNLKIAANLLDKFITDTLQRPSKVVENWIDAILLQQVNYSYDETDFNPNFAVKLPEKKEENENEEGSEEKAEEQSKEKNVTKPTSLVPSDETLKNLFIKAKKYSFAKDYKPAMKVFKEALDRAVEINDKETESKILFEIGNIYDKNDYLAQALTSYNRSVKATEDLNIKTKAHYSMAQIYDDVAQFESAIGHYLTSISYAGEAENLTAQTSSLTKIGNIYADKYDQKAFEYLSVAEDLSLETDDHNTRGYVSSNIANAHNKFNKPKDALKYYSSAVFEYTQANTPAKIAQNYKRAAELMSDYNNTEKAKRLYQKALHNAKKTDNIKLMQEIHRALQEI